MSLNNILSQPNLPTTPGNDICKDELDTSCQESAQPLPIDINSYSRLKQFQSWLKKVVQTSYNKSISMTPDDDHTAVELGKSAIVWVKKENEWADQNSIAEAQAAVEQIQKIVFNLNALANLYNNKNIT